MVLPSFPFLVEMEVTSACNLDCAYCFAKPFSGYTPSFDDLVYLIKKTKREANPFEFVLLGGEPFIRKDILDIMTVSKETFRHYGISTNGTLFRKFSKEDFSRLREVIDERTLQVSIDSIAPEINDFGRGATTKVIENLNLLEENEIPFTIAMVVNKKSKDTLLESVSYFLKKYKLLQVVNLMRLMPSRALGSTFYDLVLTREEYEQVCRKALELPESLGRPEVKVYHERNNYDGGVMMDKYAAAPPRCLAGISRAEILANGDVTPCLMLREVSLGNLYQHSWREIWQLSLARYGKAMSIPSDITLCESTNAKGEAMILKRVREVNLTSFHESVKSI